MTKGPKDVLEGTGDTGLDEILGGGVPARAVVIIAGEPGSGKTLTLLQLMFKAAARGKRVLYFTTLAEPAIKVLQHMQGFAFFDPTLLQDQIVMSDLGGMIRERASIALAAIEDRVAREEPDIVIIDSFKVLADTLRDEPNARGMLYDLAVQMAGWGCTTFLVGEYTRSEIATLAEFGIADGIIRLCSERQGLTSVREVEVIKLRGTAHQTGTHFFDIRSSGVAFFPRVSAGQPADEGEDAADRASTGIAGLDDLLRGGLPRKGTTLVQGATGTGKTLLGLHFLLEGVQRGERGILFTLEETPQQLRAIARGFGWDLAALERDDRLVIRYTSPVELATDRYVYESRREIEALRASRAVFDGLTTMSLGVPSETRFKEMVYAIAKQLRALGTTSLMTSETPQLVGATQVTADSVSFIADNVIQLRYVEIDGQLERMLSVLKARGISHATELRALAIDSSGATVTQGRFQHMRGMLTGIPAEKIRRE